ncbi:MAG TPA: xanthine dehydrogenase family protein [Firmicutes bacterium]|jgi:CO/xanthine dehydrogenase Mo-binding subunit|nr:xanthine dehydrogenase family protein [Bacillota bacterium]
MYASSTKTRMVNALEKVTGQARFTEDLEIPGLLYGVAVYSNISKGFVRKVDLEAAQKVPGVKKILLPENIPGRNLLGSHELSHPIISSKINYFGDAVALIAAESEEIARKAACLVKVDYEEKEGIYTIDEAMENGDLLFNHLQHFHGDIEAGFEKSDVIIDGTYFTPFIDHIYLERESALALPEPNGRLTIYGGCQEPYHMPTVVSEVLNCPREQIRFIGMSMGGAFGGKSEDSFMVACRAALLAVHCMRPVLFVVSREESMRSSTKRHEAKLYYKIGASKQGELTALEARVYLNKGAYLGSGGKLPPALNRVYWHYTGPYRIPNTVLNAYLLRTNNPCSGQMRSPGVPQICFAVESIMDQLAEALNMDPLEFRLKNVLEAGEVTANGIYLKDSVGIREAIQKGSRLFDWDSRRSRGSQGDTQTLKGVGMASSWHGISYGNEKDTAEARIFLLHNGKFLIRTGLVELGQGLQTVLARVASEELGVPMEQITITSPDTDIDPDSKNTTSSRATVVGSLAIRLAAQEAIKNLISHAARLKGGAASDFFWKGGIVHSKNSAWSINLADLAAQTGSERPLLVGNGKWQDKAGKKGYTTYGYAAHFVELEVDRKTGYIKLLRLVVAQDVGKVLNYQTLKGQAIGSAMMSAGYGLLENIILEKGKILNPNLRDYRIPLFTECPSIKCVFIEDPCSEYVFGAKGAGEPSAVPTASAIANAYYNATGLRIYRLPITQENITGGKKQA